MVTHAKCGASTRRTVLCHGPGHTPWIVTTFGAAIRSGAVAMFLAYSGSFTVVALVGNHLCEPPNRPAVPPRPARPPSSAFPESVTERGCPECAPGPAPELQRRAGGASRATARSAAPNGPGSRATDPPVRVYSSTASPAGSARRGGAARGPTCSARRASRVNFRLRTD